jgi:hypothetical protein
MNPNLLYDTIHAILLKARGPRFRHKATFVSANGSAAAIAVIEKWSSADYVSSFCRDMTIQVATSVKDYRDVLYARRDNLKCVLQKIQVDPVSGVDVIGGITTSYTYRAFLVDNADATLPHGNPMTSGTYLDGKDDMRYFHVQLVDPVAEFMSVRSGGGISRYNSNEDFLKALVLTAAKSEKGEQSVYLKGFEMVPSVNKGEITPDFVVPHSVPLIDVPGWIQENENGLYDKGLGSFIQDGIWYIYPLYRTNHLKTAVKKLVVFQVPTNVVPLLDNTSYQDGDTLYVVCTGSPSIQDISVSGNFEYGNGVRFIRADELMAAPTAQTENTALLNRSKYMAEFQDSTREDGFAIAGMSSVKATNNVPFEMSKLAANDGQLFTTTWQNSNADLVFPGMPVQVYHDIGGKIKKYGGTMFQIDEQWALERPGLSDQTQTSVAGMVMFLSKNSE